MRIFLLGAVVGATAMWMWGDRVRAQFSEQIDGVVDQVLGVLDRVEDGLDALRTRVDALASSGVRPADRRDLRAAGE
jgi:hypothetical protein